MSINTYMAEFTDELTIINGLLSSGVIVYDDDYRQVMSMLRNSLKKIDKCVNELEKYDDETIQLKYDEVSAVTLLLDLVGQSYDLIEKKLHTNTGIYHEERKRQTKINV